MAKFNVKFFENKPTGELLAVVNTTPEQFLIRLVANVAYIDVDVDQLGSYTNTVKGILSHIMNVSKIAVLNGVTEEFIGDEIKVKGFNNFKLELDESKFQLNELESNLGVASKRVFDYDFTNPEIEALAKENDERIKYYVKPKYFEFLKSNVSNKAIKGMSLIGVPGTGKSTDAVAVIRDLGGVILTAQLSGGTLENDLFTNVLPNTTVEDYVRKIERGVALTPQELEQYELLSKSSSTFRKVDEVIMKGIKNNIPVLLDELAYSNPILMSKFNVLTDGTVTYWHEGKEYFIPDNFFLFFTWNPGDVGTNDIPNALKTRFPIFIIPAIDKETHYKRIKAYTKSVIGYDKLDKKWIDNLFDFGNLIEQHQQKLRHSGGFFTLRATQMFLATVLTSVVDKDTFLLELKSKFVNYLWGTNYEMTNQIEDTLSDSLFATRIEELWNDYPVKPVPLSTDKINILDLLDVGTDSVDNTESISDGMDDILSDLDDLFSGK